jgi:hypothetical protein
MKTGFILLMTIVIFAALLAANCLPQGAINFGATPSYAMGPNHWKTDPNRTERNSGRSSVPEPSSLMLMGGGVIGVGFYLFVRNKGKKK